MDPVTAIGLAAAVVNFVELGSKITKRLRELSEAGDVPEVFRDIRTRLPLLTSIIVYTQHCTENLSPEARQALEKVVSECFEQVTQLDDVLRKVVISRGDSRIKKTFKAVVSLVEEGRVQRIATALRDNVQLLTFLNVAPAEDGRPPAERRPSEPLLSHPDALGIFLVPFSRDEHFVGRSGILQLIDSNFEKDDRVAISGIGGVGKSQIAIEYCYRFKASNADAHVFWVYGGTIARFYEGYKRIAQRLDLPGWDDPEESILELVCSWLSTTKKSYLLVIDNADTIEHWWPGKYKSGGSLDDPSNNLSKYLPDRDNSGKLLITTRDNRVAGRLTTKTKPIAVQPMSAEEARSLFISKFDREDPDFDEKDVQNLVEELDYLPLAVSQAAAFIQENPVSLVEYLSALQGEDAEEYLHEELDDSRRDEESVNSVFRTWKLSYDQIRKQKPRAAEVLSLFAMLDRQNVPKFLLKVPEVATSLGVLQSFNLVTTRAGSQGFQIHRLVQRFVQHALQKENTTQKWQEKALESLSADYPMEIGVGQWPICDMLAPHVHVVTKYKYRTVEARLNLAHMLCWAADFDIERGMYNQALDRAHESLNIFRELVPERDERLAAVTWLYGRLRYYRAQSTSDINVAEELLTRALSISKYPSLNFGETAFELAHLYYDQGNEKSCLEMGKASFECWKEAEGPNSVRTLDNQHDYALELALFGHVEEGIATWEEIVERCPASDASETTKTVFTYRSMAGIAEFRGDAPMAEIFYAKLIRLCEAIYYPEHIHVFDYRLSHAEQIMRQGRLEETITVSKAILESCHDHSEWRITASCLQTIAECYKLQGSFGEEQPYRLKALRLHETKLGRDHKETIDAEEALADCYLNSSTYSKAKNMYQTVYSWRKADLGETQADTLRALECLSICDAGQDQESIPASETLPKCPPVKDVRRFGRMIHPRTWSA